MDFENHLLFCAPKSRAAVWESLSLGSKCLEVEFCVRAVQDSEHNLSLCPSLPPLPTVPPKSKKKLLQGQRDSVETGRERSRRSSSRFRSPEDEVEVAEDEDEEDSETIGPVSAHGW